MWSAKAADCSTQRSQYTRYISFVAAPRFKGHDPTCCAVFETTCEIHENTGHVAMYSPRISHQHPLLQQAGTSQSQLSAVVGRRQNRLSPSPTRCNSTVVPYKLGKTLHVKALKCDYFILELLVCLPRVLQRGQSLNLFFVDGILLFGHLLHSLENIFCRFRCLQIKRGGGKKKSISKGTKDEPQYFMHSSTICQLLSN